MDGLQSAEAAQAELGFILSLKLNTKDSPVPRRTHSRRIARTLTQSRWPDQVLGRPVASAERPIIEARLTYWAHTYLERGKRRKKKKTAAAA